MGITFTKEQQSAIDLRNRNILVSAAAGSGKTAVLVQRVLARLTKELPLVDIDQLLIVTYTEAAASEMRERIRDAIERALEEDPENLHLQRQSTLVHRAQITTIHGFCLNVIRDYFHTIDLDPAFRVGETGELNLLKRDVIEELLEAQYQEGSPEFLRFIESYSSGKDDRKIVDFILKLYEHSRSYPSPEDWLGKCVRQYDVPTEEALEQTDLVKRVMGQIDTELKECIETTEQAILFCESEGGPLLYADALRLDLEMFEKLRGAQSFRKMQEGFQAISWARLASHRGLVVLEEKISLVKAMRDQCKAMIKSMRERFLYDDISVMRRDLYETKSNMEMLATLTLDFATAYREKKHSKNMVDFDDMMYYAMQILTEKHGDIFVPSAVAKEYQNQFVEVMIDEYQDSNLVQDTILTSVSRVQSGEPNIFMVGDVKQSIYRFRLSMPELFMEKYDSYSEGESSMQKIDLHQNFRSRKAVLDSVNYVFEQLMTKEFGGILYDEKAALVYGDTYEETKDSDTEVCFVNAEGLKRREAIELQALALAKRIKELVGTQEVYDRKTDSYRKAGYGDMVILVRTLQGWADVFQQVMTECGVPVYTSSKTGYFQVREIQMLLDYLRILDNPRQDIPFAAVLHSGFGRISSEELAQIKNHTNEKSLYERALAYAAKDDADDLCVKLQSFFTQFDALRSRVPYTAIHTLLWQIMEETGYEHYVAALPAGEQRLANVNMLIEKAIAFETTSYKGLFHFVRYIDQLQKYEVDFGEASISEEGNGVVQLMSIHKSKGLEFPIVFVAGMDKEFNVTDANAEMVLHPTWGVGLPVVDVEKRTKAPTLMKHVIQKEVIAETVAEELRILYVAMTRAKEKLILIGSVGKMEGYNVHCARLLGREERALPYLYISGAKKYLDWMIPALYRKTNQIPITQRWMDMGELWFTESTDMTADYVTREELLEWNVEDTYDAQMKEMLAEQFSFTYPYLSEQKQKQKVSVSELKKRVYMEEEEIEEEVVIPFLPRFLKEEQPLTGAVKGTAYHRVLELLDFAKVYDEATLAHAIERMVEAGLMTAQDSACICREEILTFLRSSIGRRMHSAAKEGKLHKEQPFVLGENQGGVVLVQGIIDVYFEEDDEFVVLDYKTDRVSKAEELIERYQVQLQYYAKALTQISCKPVKEQVIYSFALQKEIQV